MPSELENIRMPSELEIGIGDNEFAAVIECKIGTSAVDWQHPSPATPGAGASGSNWSESGLESLSS
jgi:hypothetical protein